MKKRFLAIGTVLLSILLAAYFTGCGGGDGSTPSLVSIAIAPTNPSINVGAIQQFTVSGTYSDGSTKPITNGVTWNSSNTALATVNEAGVATGIAAGTAFITATVQNITAGTFVVIGTQVWILTFGPSTNSEGPFVVRDIGYPYGYAKVTVTPSSDGGSFAETNDSGGVIFHGKNDGSCSYRVPVEGNISRYNTGDTWDLVNFGGAGCGYQTLCTGSGTAAGISVVNGHLSCITQSGFGQVAFNDRSWYGILQGANNF